MEREIIIDNAMEFWVNFLGSLAISAVLMYSCFHLIDNWFGDWFKSYRKKIFAEAETQQDASFGLGGLSNVDIGNFTLSTATECPVNGETIEQAVNLLEGSEGMCEGLAVLVESSGEGIEVIGEGLAVLAESSGEGIQLIGESLSVLAESVVASISI